MKQETELHISGQPLSIEPGPIQTTESLLRMPWPSRDEKSRAYRVPVEPEWFQERDCVVIAPVVIVKEAFTPKAGDDMAFDGYDLDMLEINLWARLNGQSL